MFDQSASLQTNMHGDFSFVVTVVRDYFNGMKLITFLELSKTTEIDSRTKVGYMLKVGQNC